MQDQVRHFIDELINILNTIEVSTQRGEFISFYEGVNRAIKVLRERTGNGGKIMFIGNGGSSAIASHFALDYWHAGGMRSITFDSSPQLTCLSNDHGYDQVYAIPVKLFAEQGDVLVAISSSGNSANILNGVISAQDNQCTVLTLSGFEPDNKLREMGDFNFYVPSKSYGYVELTHDIILHAILDLAAVKQCK